MYLLAFFVGLSVVERKAVQNVTIVAEHVVARTWLVSVGAANQSVLLIVATSDVQIGSSWEARITRSSAKNSLGSSENPTGAPELRGHFSDRPSN